MERAKDLFGDRDRDAFAIRADPDPVVTNPPEFYFDSMALACNKYREK
jgi:hypothetical protein